MEQCSGKDDITTATYSVAASPLVSTATTASSVAQKSKNRFEKSGKKGRQVTERDVLILRHRLLLKEEERVKEQLSLIREEKASLVTKCELMKQKFKYIEAKHENIQLQNELLKLEIAQKQSEVLQIVTYTDADPKLNEA